MTDPIVEILIQDTLDLRDAPEIPVIEALQPFSHLPLATMFVAPVTGNLHAVWSPAVDAMTPDQMQALLDAMTTMIERKRSEAG